MPSKTLIVIAGPTAIGKTALAIKLAVKLGTEILSADSRQFYREMNIGTAKPSEEELSVVKHYFIDSLSISEKYTVGDFEAEAISTLEKIFQNHNAAVLVGGSGLFINAVCNGFDELPKAPLLVRESLNKLFAEKGIEALQEKLKAVDPEYFNQVDQQNPQRLIRALEIYEASGKPFSSFRTKQISYRSFKIIKIGLNAERSILYQRINRRVDEMVASGLIEEVKSLMPFRHLNALNTVGYSELFDYFDGKISLEQAIEQIKQNTRRFAKRQLTWFRKDTEMRWFEPTDFDGIVRYVNEQISAQA
ncbi:MAG: miaA [Sphingobacteriaceae bacterium]|jgi:tRNA dimethylallyltransferase|nr:miaA [Sphingobacteriaceae bacterium]